MLQNPVVLVHTIVATVALLIGAFIFLRPKANSLHRMLGFVYAVAMLITLCTAFAIFELTGAFNIVHVFAGITTVLVCMGLCHLLSRKPNGAWLKPYYAWMSWSYLALFFAFLAEITVDVIKPYLHDQLGVRSFGWYWSITGIASFTAVCVVHYVMKQNQKRTIRF